MSVSIRAATTADRTRCFELLDQLSAATGTSHSDAGIATFDELTTGQRGTVLVAEEDGRLLGMASVSFNLAIRYGGEYCQLEELIVDPAARGKNVGGLLVQGTVDMARSRGCREYGLYLIESTEHNRPFYEKYGFRAVGTEMRQTF